ncbi:hypothetical protein BX600DRAFT_454943 [Xylariales sp. PMI_506]|nr:hypothetical protein BX600DRAFT_454943 [Xylariales sp. PMI_506]
METTLSLTDVASSLLEQQSLSLVACRPVQSLWAGYGQICEITANWHQHAAAAEDSVQEPVALILKYISPPVAASTKGEGHVRKILSYQVEQYFYRSLAPGLPESVAVAACIESICDGTTTAIVLKDLRTSQAMIKPNAAFPVSLQKRGGLTEVQAIAALNWLAGFHGHFWKMVATFDRGQMVLPPLEELSRRQRVSDKGFSKSSKQSGVKGVWLNGGYTYLGTRQEEYTELANDRTSDWSEVLCKPSLPNGQSLAEHAANLLTPNPSGGSSGPISEYETLIHGDVKSENMFASECGNAVAFFDFQYVGLGLGVCDLAKLFTCSVPLSMLLGQDPKNSIEVQLSMQSGEKKLLLHYLRQLEMMSAKSYPWEIFVRHWEIALVDWLRFQASWGFWGNTDWLEARVRFIIENKDW